MELTYFWRSDRPNLITHTEKMYNFTMHRRDNNKGKHSRVEIRKGPPEEGHLSRNLRMKRKTVAAGGHSRDKGTEIGNNFVHLKHKRDQPATLTWREYGEPGHHGIVSCIPHLLPEGLREAGRESPS